MTCRPVRVAVTLQRGSGCCTSVHARWASRLASLAQQRRPAAKTTALCGNGVSAYRPPLSPSVTFLDSRRGAARRAARSPTVRRVERQQAAARPPAAPPAPVRLAPAGVEDDASSSTDTFVPALDNAMAALGLFAFASRDECVAALAAGRRVLQSRTTASEALLERVHSLAVLLLFGGSSLPAKAAAGAGNPGAQCFSLAMALLHLAASSSPAPGGYLPATLTIVNMFGVDAGAHKASVGAKMRQSRMYQAAEKQFLAYIAASQRGGVTSADELTPFDVAMRANAFTLAGVLAEAAGDPARAVRWCIAAQAAGQADSDKGDDIHPREPAWDWEARCLVVLGRLLPPGAERTRALSTAALALGSGEACMLLAGVYEEGEGDGAQHRQEEIDDLLHQAAVGDTPRAMDALAAREERRAARRAETAPAEAAEHRQLAAEWRQLATAATAGVA